VTGQTISHYEILEKLGEGGMGVVYRARDTKLDRTVALKFLSQNLTTSEEDKQRFIREAKAAASLNHRHICTVYSVEEHDGRQFISMEYIDGVTLRDKMQSAPITKGELRGALSLDDAINFTLQIAEAFAAAHRKGIIHRDLKPENIFLTSDNQIKIIDFGLARVAERSLITKSGITLGTVPYMSPEQAQGNKVDHRTDIWSLGVVMYEMITGQRPFRSEYETALVYSILNEDPEPVTGLRSGVPITLENIILKCLEKDPHNRYQHTDELIVDIRRVEKEMLPDVPSGTAASRKRKSELPSLAVLPFMGIRSNPETDFLGFALADQIISALTYIKSIVVRPSSAVRKYQNTSVDPLSAGKELHVDFILIGYYLKEAENIRLNVELVNTQTDDMTWRESVEVTYENVFKLQDIVSEKVIRGLEVQFSQNERDRIRANVPIDPLAYEYYLRSKAYPSTIEGSRIAVKMLEYSIQLDRSYAPAWVDLAYHYHRLASYATGEFGLLDKAQESLYMALSINPDLLSALSGLTVLNTEMGRMKEAVSVLHRALEINPNNSYTYFSFSYVYRYAGLLDESRRAAEKALALDPHNPHFRSLGNTYFYLGQYEKAYEIFDLDKSSTFSLAWQGSVLFRQGKPEDALNCFTRVIMMEPEGNLGLWSKVMKAYLEGKSDEGLEFTRLHERLLRFDGESWYHNASLYALFRDTDGCNRTLRKAVEFGFINYPFMVKDTFLDSMRDDSEFQQIMATVHKKHENFKNEYVTHELTAYRNNDKPNQF
jgi:eukaryotic-like serine/threonine-protein kinase